MKPIKFRGRSLSRGKWVYGHIYIPSADVVFIIQETNPEENTGYSYYGDSSIKIHGLVVRVDPITVG